MERIGIYGVATTKTGLWPSSFFKNQTNDEDKCRLIPGISWESL